MEFVSLFWLIQFLVNHLVNFIWKEPDINSTMVGRDERWPREEEPQGMSNNGCIRSQNVRIFMDLFKLILL